jgi:hypothetical protein
MPQQRVGVCADGALAVGACDVYGLPWEFDMLEEEADALQSRLDHGGEMGSGVKAASAAWDVTSTHSNPNVLKQVGWVCCRL